MRIGLLGIGAYGLSLSSILTHNYNEVVMWTRFEEEKELLEQQRSNEKLLPGFRLDEKIKITTNVKECITDKDLLIIAIPAAFVSDLCKDMAPYHYDLSYYL